VDFPQQPHGEFARLAPFAFSVIWPNVAPVREINPTIPHKVLRWSTSMRS